VARFAHVEHVAIFRFEEQALEHVLPEHEDPEQVDVPEFGQAADAKEIKSTINNRGIMKYLGFI
jgi:hypothetical protein